MAEHKIPFNPQFKLNRISYSRSALKSFASALVTSGKSFEKAIGNFLSDWLDDSTTIEVKTSGSTGIPKNILLQKQHMVNSALATGDFFDLIEGNTALLCLPTGYIAGKMMLVRAMVLGLELDYVEPSSNPLMGVSKTYDFAAMVPLQLECSISKIELIKTLIVGGASVSSKLKEKVQNKSTAVYETYGMTETITHVAVKRTNGMAKRTRSNFNAILDLIFSIDNRECLVITAPKVSDNPVVTNDVVNLVSKTEFEWLGRYDNVINSGGIKLHPEVIEQKLSSLIENRYFVSATPDEKLGERLVLVIEGKVNTEQLLESLQQDSSFKRFEIPKHIYTLPYFLTTETGKILRNKNLLLLNK